MTRGRPPLPRRNDLSTGVYNRSPNSARPASTIRHDDLHMMPGLKFCHCMCTACWDRVISRCICLACPCSRGR